MLSVRCLSVCLSVSLSCLSVLSVTFVHCGQTVVRIKMKLGMPVGLGRVGPGHIVLGGHSPPIFGPYLLRSNGCMDQDVTWYGARPRPRRLCVRRGPISPPAKGTQELPLFGPCLLCPRSPISATAELFVCTTHLCITSWRSGLDYSQQQLCSHEHLHNYSTRAQKLLRWATVWPQ